MLRPRSRQSSSPTSWTMTITEAKIELHQAFARPGYARPANQKQFFLHLLHGLDGIMAPTLPEGYSLRFAFLSSRISSLAASQYIVQRFDPSKITNRELSSPSSIHRSTDPTWYASWRPRGTFASFLLDLEFDERNRAGSLDNSPRTRTVVVAASARRPVWTRSGRFRRRRHDVGIRLSAQRRSLSLRSRHQDVDRLPGARAERTVLGRPRAQLRNRSRPRLVENRRIP